MTPATQSNTPPPRNIRVDALPKAIRESTRAVLWRLETRDGKPTKVPYCAERPHEKASTTDPATWARFATAFRVFKSGRCDGVGVVLGDGRAGIDLDKCRDPETGHIDDEARAIIAHLNSYTEVSVSGSGVHILIRGTLPPGRRKIVRPNFHIEMYDDGRYFTLSGQHVEGTPTTIEQRTTELATLHAQVFPQAPESGLVRAPVQSPPVSLDDAALLDRASNATNGAKFSALWHGDTGEYGGDESAADLALCNLLAFWTGCDAARMDALFQQSGLMRDKWNSRRGESTYGAQTIARAMANCRETYTGPVMSAPRSAPRPALASGSAPPSSSELYGLGRLQTQRPQIVFIAERASDVDALVGIGVPEATCRPAGGGWAAEHVQLLQSCGVQYACVLPNDNQDGRARAEHIASTCRTAGVISRILPLSGTVAGWIAAGGTRPPLIALADALPAWQPAQEVDRVAVTRGDRPDPDTGTPDASDEEPPQLPPWPRPLAPHAYLGVVGDIVQALAPETEADPVALLLQLLAMFGNVIGRTAHFTVEADTHYLNLFVTLVGATAKGRKGVSYGRIEAVLKPIAPSWGATSGLSSGEGLIWAVRDPIEKQTPIKVNGRVIDYQTVIDDPGIADKRLLVLEPELASTLRVMARDSNTLSAIMRQAWDGRTLRVLTKTSPATATGAHLSVISHITADELRRYLDVTETANGWANRFLLACVQRSNTLPDGGRYVDLDPFIERLRGAVELAQRAGAMSRDADARTLWHTVYADLSAGRPGLLGSMTARAEAQVMRLACLYALTDQSAVVRLAHLRAALEVWRYCFASAAFIFGDALGNPVADEILRALRAHSGGLTRTDIRALFSNNRPASEVSRALALLKSIRLAECVSVPDTGGRPAERWHATRQTDYALNAINAVSAGGDGGDTPLTALNAFNASPVDARPGAVLTHSSSDTATRPPSVEASQATDPIFDFANASPVSGLDPAGPATTAARRDDDGDPDWEGLK